MTTVPKQITVEPWDISPDEEQAFRATDDTFQWLCSLSGDALSQHAGKWVAAKDCRIIATGDTLDMLLEQLGDVDLQSVVLDRIERPGWTIR
jgi:hypothetical protein